MLCTAFQVVLIFSGNTSSRDIFGGADECWPRGEKYLHKDVQFDDTYFTFKVRTVQLIIQKYYKKQNNIFLYTQNIYFLLLFLQSKEEMRLFKYAGDALSSNPSITVNEVVHHQDKIVVDWTPHLYLFWGEWSHHSGLRLLKIG